MAAWETEDESSGLAADTLPTPHDTLYRTPSNGSKQSRRSATPPGTKSTSPPLQPADKGGKTSKRSSRDVSNDNTISVLDPRRFTPTLHANLVAEILNLRRDQEEKIKLIENLEASLDSTRHGKESLQESLLTTSKEARSLKRQLSLLEGGTSSALGELARERDDAVDSITDTRKRLEAAQRKIRHQEEDSQRVHDLWTQEKESWLEEKRKYERKIHVAESRLKVVLDEVAAYQDAEVNGDGHGNGANGTESEVEDGAKDDNASIRTMSMTNSIRFSTSQSPGKNNGNSLADELNLDGDDDWHTDDGGRESVLSNRRHTRNMSRDSVVSRFHQRNQSIESLKRPGSVARGRLWANEPVLEALEDGIEDDIKEDDVPPAPKVTYMDAGIQYSPPPSPKLIPTKPATPEPPAKVDRSTEVESPPRIDLEIEANQRRKRVHLNKPLVVEPQSRAQHQMVSVGSQTVEEPPSPPKASKSSYRSMTPPPAEIKPVPTVSVSTQTEPEKEEPKPTPEKQPPLPEFAPMPQLPIPSISVIPPTSRPTTPRQSLLPQYNKDFGCQVSLLDSRSTTQSVGVQTEEIRIDQRLAQLPDHLRPEAISSRPPSPNPQNVATNESGTQFTPVPSKVPPRNPRRLANKRSVPDMSAPSHPPIPPVSPTLPAHPSAPAAAPVEDIPLDAYPGNNDDGPLSAQKVSLRRPHRISSLFAGFDANSSDEVDEFAEIDLSDAEYRTALTAPGQRPGSTVVRPSKRSSSGTVASPEQPKLRRSALPRSTVKSLGTESYSYSLESKEMTKDKEPPPQRPSLHKARQRSYDKAASGPNGKLNGMRKAAMIQSGIASHQGRSRSPSLPEARQPPFPIPTRASSRRPPISASAPSDGQRSPTAEGPWHRRNSGRSSYRPSSIRKVRSAAALPRNQRYRRQGSRSPPPFSETTETPESPGLPPLPQNDITTPRHFKEPSRTRYRSSHRSQPSTNTAQTNQTNTTDPNSAPSAMPATGVVDAIAQAMVGEWMFKYVRRRKSFNPAESSGKDDNSNDRHKRWVWLAPYERAILWSSKQPSSGSALMGKTGRKLTIQSVLDVKDDNPAPKGGLSFFNRSILILTPQRALKFTATSSERHYIWLTSLSFLAHSQQAVPEIIAAPPPPKAIAPDFEMPPQPKRKTGIRDSIRLTKSKAPSLKAAEPPSIPSIPSIPDVPNNASAPSSQMGDVSSFHDMSSTYRQQEAFPPLPEIDSFQEHQRERSGDAAEPPLIPRFQERANQAMVHGRKRSNTGGHVPPPLSFRGFSGPATAAGTHSYTNSNTGNSVGTNGSSDIYHSQQSQASSGGPSWGMSTGGSQRTSDASSRPSNFFDAIGTVRMEAFISPLAHSQFDGDPDEEDELRYRARRRSKELRRRASRSRHRDSYNSRSTHGTDDYYAGSSGGRVVEDDFFRDDPFRGF